MRRLVERPSCLNNTQARKEQASAGGTFSTKRPHFVAPELYQLERIQDPREKAHAIRALKSSWRDDPKSAFNDVKHGDHKSAVEWMQRLYQAESELGPMDEDQQE